MDDITRPGRRPEGATPFVASSRNEGPNVHADIAGVAPRRAPAPVAHSMHDGSSTETAYRPASTTENIAVGHPAPMTPPAPRPMPSSTPTNPIDSVSSSPSITPADPLKTMPNPPASVMPEQQKTDSSQSTHSGSTGDQTPSLLAEIEDQGKTDADGKVQQAPSSPIKKKHNIAAIMIAVVMALGLIAGAGYAYWQNNKTAQPETQSTPKTSTNSVQEESTTTTDNVDNTSKAIDEAIKSIDETKEFQATDISDATLGL